MNHLRSGPLQIWRLALVKLGQFGIIPRGAGRAPRARAPASFYPFETILRLVPEPMIWTSGRSSFQLHDCAPLSQGRLFLPLCRVACFLFCSCSLFFFPVSDWLWERAKTFLMMGTRHDFSICEATQERGGRRA